MPTWWLYLIEKRKRLYVGITTNLKKRLVQHGNPALLYAEGPLTREEATRREREIKGWRREKKLQLAGGCR